ncbi:unnamed protein product, partial [Brassica rapa]
SCSGVRPVRTRTLPPAPEASFLPHLCFTFVSPSFSHFPGCSASPQSLWSLVLVESFGFGGGLWFALRRCAVNGVQSLLSGELRCFPLTRRRFMGQLMQAELVTWLSGMARVGSISGIEDGLVLGGVSWFVMFAPLHCGRLAYLVSSYCCMVLVWRQALVINYFCAGSETVCSEFSGNLNPVFRRLAFGGDVLRALFSSPV